MTAVVQRTVFATPRAAEFLEQRALQAQTGQPITAFGSVVIKELIDNALDAAESAGRAPNIEITTRTDDGITFVTVADNGAGITTASIEKIIDFSVLASDKARYRGPARGAQGNALKTLLGIPFALDVAEPVVIESGGIRHAVAVSADPAGDVHVAHNTTVSDRTVGTAATVPLPDHLEIDADGWAFNAALVNPHATITVNNRAHKADGGGPIFYKPSESGWSKWTPAMPSSPHWYDKAAFTALVYSHIREIKSTGVDVPLGGFITEFDGLSGSAKQKAIRAAAPGVTHLSGLEGHDDLIAGLLDAMLTHAKPTAPQRLGPVGKDHLERLLHGRYGVRRFWYKSTTVIDHGVAWITEVAVADTEEPGGIWFGCNHAPAFGDPLGRTVLRAGDIHTTGAMSFLTRSGVDFERAAVVHVICAATQFVDKGKVALVVPATVADAAAKALESATKVIRREDEQRRKDARKSARAMQRARERVERDERATEWTVKNAVFQVLPKAKDLAGDVVSARTLYYKVRPLLQDYTDRELDYGYFSQNLLPEYERTIAPLRGLYYEARGKLHHPHDGTVVPLGTREVKSYTPPPWQFDKVLYIEKEGLEAQLEPYRLGEKYDMAIIYGKGYAATACRDLLASRGIRDMKLFVVHDADVDGYNIARTLSEATRRMPDHNVEVIDLGLTVQQAIDAGLETEVVTRRRELPGDLDLDAADRAWFVGTPVTAGYGKTHWVGQRCELNAFSADELAAFIEDGLLRHGATTKLIPPPDVLAASTVTSRNAILKDLVIKEVFRRVDVAAVASRIADQHPHLLDVDENQIRDVFTERPHMSWSVAVTGIVVDAVNDIDGLGGTIAALIAEQIADAS